MLRRKLIIAFALLIVSPAFASVIEFTNKSQWEAAVGSFTTIDFVFPEMNIPITDQYADQGIRFSGSAYSHATGSYVNDGWGMFGVGGAWAHFDTPQKWIAVDYPGGIRFELFLNGESVYLSTYFVPTGSGNFAGLLSSVPFDEVFLHRPKSFPANNVFIDDLHFGTSIPAPGAIGLLALGGLVVRRRRRT